MIINNSCELCKRPAGIEKRIQHEEEVEFDGSYENSVHSRLCNLDPDYKPCTITYRIFCDYCKHYTGPWREDFKLVEC